MYLIFLSRNNILVKHVQKSNLKNIIIIQINNIIIIKYFD